MTAEQLAAFGQQNNVNAYVLTTIVEQDIDGRTAYQLENIDMVELSSGNTIKGKKLIAALRDLKQYHPLDSPQDGEKPYWDEPATAAKILIQSSLRSSIKLWDDKKFNRVYEIFDDVATLLISRPMEQIAIAKLALEDRVSLAQSRANKRAESSPKKAAVILRKGLLSYLRLLIDAVEGVDTQTELAIVTIERQKNATLQKRLNAMKKKMQSMEEMHKQEILRTRQDATQSEIRANEKLEKMKKKCRDLKATKDRLQKILTSDRQKPASSSIGSPSRRNHKDSSSPKKHTSSGQYTPRVNRGGGPRSPVRRRPQSAGSGSMHSSRRTPSKTRPSSAKQPQSPSPTSRKRQARSPRRNIKPSDEGGSKKAGVDKKRPNSRATSTKVPEKNIEELKETKESSAKPVTHKKQNVEKDVIYLRGESAHVFNGFVELLKEHMQDNAHLGEEGALLETFNVFDEDGSGTIDVCELHEAIVDLGTSEDGTDEVSLESVREIMNHIDLDGVGEINFPQFKRVVYTTAKKLPPTSS